MLLAVLARATRISEFREDLKITLDGHLRNRAHIQDLSHSLTTLSWPRTKEKKISKQLNRFFYIYIWRWALHNYNDWKDFFPREKHTKILGSFRSFTESNLKVRDSFKLMTQLSLSKGLLKATQEKDNYTYIKCMSQADLTFCETATFFTTVSRAGRKLLRNNWNIEISRFVYSLTLPSTNKSSRVYYKYHIQTVICLSKAKGKVIRRVPSFRIAR